MAIPEIIGAWYVVNENKTLQVRAVRKGKDVVLVIPEGFWVCMLGDRLIAIYQPDTYQGALTFATDQDSIGANCTPIETV